MPVPLSVLYVDPTPENRQRVAEAFNRAGVQLRYVNEVSQTLRGLRALKPQLLLVHAEVRSPTVTQILDAVASDTAFAHLPILLLCRDVSDRRFLHQLRSGILGLLEQPFSADRHIAELQAIHAELPDRVGSVSGHGDSRELAAVVEHLCRTQRSGALTVNARTPEEGKALFVRGVLQSAEHLGAAGVEALLAMVATPRASWTFSEVHASSSQVVVDLPATTGEHPLAPVEPEEAQELQEPAIALEVGEVVSNEHEVAISAQAPARRVDPKREVLSILLVDDDESLCRMFSILFRKHGFEVTTAPDGLAGYAAALSRRFELVVADLNMPRMDGWGLLKLLRDDHRTRELPVVFLSAHDDYRDTLRALDSGAQGYFSKSTRLDAMAAQVRSVLEPRLSFRQQLATTHTIDVPVGKLGPQWLVLEIARAGVSGRVAAKDSWAQYQLTVWDGRPVHALAQAGRHVAEGERALNAFLASRGAEGTFERGEFPANANIYGSAEELVAKACALLNDKEARIRDHLLVQANDLRIDPELYALYAQVGPRQWLETARLICEKRMSPREVIAQVNASPIEVEDTLKDLVRRGVVTLSA